MRSSARVSRSSMLLKLGSKTSSGASPANRVIAAAIRYGLKHWAGLVLRSGLVVPPSGPISIPRNIHRLARSRDQGRVDRFGCATFRSSYVPWKTFSGSHSIQRCPPNEIHPPQEAIQVARLVKILGSFQPDRRNEPHRRQVRSEEICAYNGDPDESRAAQCGACERGIGQVRIPKRREFQVCA
jgi:hypothetical protein